MADTDIVPNEDASLDDVSLIDNQIAPPGDADQSSSTAEEGKDNAAATETDADTNKDTLDAKETEAKVDPATDQQPPEQKREADKALAAREFQNRQRARQEVAEKIDQNYGPKTAAELVDEEGITPEQAEIKALRLEMAYDKQRTAIAELNAGMMSEAVNVTNDFQVFNPNSKEYDKEFTEQVERQYAIAARLEIDEQGIITNAETPLYDFYQSMAKIYSRGASRGSQETQADMATMLSRTEDIGSSTSAATGSETFEEMEARLGDQVIT